MADTARTRLLDLVGPFAGLILVVALFAALEPGTFLSVYNLQTIAAQTVIVGLGAIGMTFVIVSGGIDLSVGSVIALSSVVTALALRDAWSRRCRGRCGRDRRRWRSALRNGVVIAGRSSCPSSSRSARWAWRAESRSTSRRAEGRRARRLAGGGDDQDAGAGVADSWRPACGCWPCWRWRWAPS